MSITKFVMLLIFRHLKRRRHSFAVRYCPYGKLSPTWSGLKVDAEQPNPHICTMRHILTRVTLYLFLYLPELFFSVCPHTATCEPPIICWGCFLKAWGIKPSNAPTELHYKFFNKCRHDKYLKHSLWKCSKTEMRIKSRT